jgi:predicted deacylase
VKSIITLPTASMRSREAIVDHSAIVDNPLESTAGMSDTRVSCTIDLTAEGKQFGTLGVPRSSNQWSRLVVPIVSIANGPGPTVTVIGGVHGDEPEGQVAALNLARSLQPEQVTGRVIVVPCASPEASRAYTRTWPSGINFNRSFPGDPMSTEDEQPRCTGSRTRSSGGRWSTG